MRGLRAETRRWLEPAVLEQCLPEPERVGVGGMRDPRADPGLDISLHDGTSSPLIPQAAQPASKARDIAWCHSWLALAQPPTSVSVGWVGAATDRTPLRGQLWRA